MTSEDLRHLRMALEGKTITSVEVRDLNGDDVLSLRCADGTEVRLTSMAFGVLGDTADSGIVVT